MKMSVQLHRQYYNYICHFGTLDEVVNKILDAAERGEIEIYDNCQAAPPAYETSRYTVNITNKAYIHMVETLGARSPVVSLRRILYWFVDNEIYTVLDLPYKTLLPSQLRELKNVMTHIDTAYERTLRYIRESHLDFNECIPDIEYKLEQQQKALKELRDGI